MLVLTRKEGEKIKIGEMVTITLVKVVGTDRVRIGIEAPDDVPVDRLEIAESKKHSFNPAKRKNSVRLANFRS